MMSCKDCIHYEVCQYHITEETDFTVKECDHFFEAVVCCKDCKYSTEEIIKICEAKATVYRCVVHDSIFDARDFCNYGQREDDDDES